MPRSKASVLERGRITIVFMHDARISSLTSGTVSVSSERETSFCKFANVSLTSSTYEP